MSSVFRGPSTNMMDWFNTEMPFMSDKGSLLPSTFNPTVDVYETEKAFMMDIEIPGMKKDDLKIRVEDDFLNITGEKRFEKDVSDKKHKYRRMERAYGSFQRSFELPPGVDASQIEAKYDNGVLKVSVPKPPGLDEREHGRNIEIKEVK